MKILYISSLYPGMLNISKKGIPTNGMPGFSMVYNKLIQNGHKIDFVIALSLADKIRFNLNNSLGRVTLVSWSNKYYFDGIISSVKLLFHINKMIDNGEYDLLYGHGPIGVLGGIIARIRGVRFGHRVYGSASLYNDLKLDKFNRIRIFFVFLKHPLQLLSFFLKKDFMIATNDGSKSDEVHAALGLGRYSFHHWRNGVVFNTPANKEFEISEKYGQFLLYPARFVKGKNQDVAIEMVYLFNVKFTKSMNLVLIGEIVDSTYFNKIKTKIKTLGLSENVFILPAVSTLELLSFYRSSFAVFSLNRFSNFGNISIEALTAGCILISFNDGSLDQVVIHNQSGMLMNNLNHGVEIINSLYNNPSLCKVIRKSAKKSSKLNFISWDSRALEEVRLIEGVQMSCNNTFPFRKIL